MRYNNVIFDLDGTLFDTSKGVIKSVEKVIELKGLRKLNYIEKNSLIGPPIQDSFRRIYNIEEKTSKEYGTLFREIYLNEYLFDATIYDNLIELLKLLNEKGCNVAVATYKRQDCTDSLLNHFGIDKYFKCIYGSDIEGKLSKQDIINLCIKDMNTENNDKIVMIGDSEFDAIGAIKSSVDFIGVTYGFGFKNKSEVDIYNNVFCASDVNEIKSYLLSEE